MPTVMLAADGRKKTVSPTSEAAPTSAPGSPRSSAFPRVIAHLDLDAFFAAVEENRDPSLRGKPVIVGGGQRGVVATANYVARRYGVRSAMPIATARSLCPQGIFLPGDHDLYRDYSRRLMALLGTYSPLVEQVSLDEAYVDLTGTERLFGPPEGTARLIQRRVKEELELSISVGLATNKLVARWPPTTRSRPVSPWCRRAGRPSFWLLLPWNGCPGWAPLF